MKKNVFSAIALMASLLFTQTGTAQPADLTQKITSLDSIFFKAYNECDLATQAKFYSDSIEFYHDIGGLATDKKELLASTEKYICGKVTRMLEPGTIEVSPVPGFGAIEIGMHRFTNHQEGSESRPSRFVIVWKNDHDKWTITRVISLHAN